MFKILALDGGGIRGILTAILLERIELAVPGFLSGFDLFAGTSTGGLLALGLAFGIRIHEVIGIYESYGPIIFKDSITDDLTDIGRLFGAEYDLTNLSQVLTKYFGDARLKDLSKRVLISSFDLDNEDKNPLLRTWKAKFFHNIPGDDSDGNQRVVDVALKTAAAPTYFPIYEGFVDGGVVANNISMCALAQSLDGRSRAVDDVLLISFGTGKNPRHIRSKSGDWGVIQWARHIVDLVIEGSVDLVDYQCQQLLQENYLRVNVNLPKSIEMDDVAQIGLLKRLARTKDLQNEIQWINRFF